MTLIVLTKTIVYVEEEGVWTEGKVVSTSKFLSTT